MNVLFATQSDSLRLFDALRIALGARVPIERAGFTVADSWVYRDWLAQRPTFEQEGHFLLKEWEVTARRHGKPDLAKLAAYERELGCEAGLFGAIVADRRLFMGPDCTYTQDYRRRFGDDELLCILENALEATERLFDELNPDLLVGFICVTMLDYVAYLFAKARGVKVMNLRSTRIGDHVAFGSTLNDPSPEFAAAYARLRAGGESPHADAARDYVARVRQEHALYEGVVKPTGKPIMTVNRGRRSPLAAASGLVRRVFEYRRSPALADNHVPDPVRTFLFTGLINPARARQTRRFLAPQYTTVAALRGTRYAFFPLHTEPEVSLLVYGRPYVNQIEIIRMLAMSLPVDMVLVVKEHPWMVGKRTLGAYRKMLDIPRVRIADPKLSARDLVAQADFVAVITGSVALEAAMLGKPVITFGDTAFNILPDEAVSHCRDPRQLPALMANLRPAPQVSDTALEHYAAAAMEVGGSVNLYSVLLGKQNVHTERASAYGEEVGKLADLLVRSMQAPSTPQGAAAW